MQLYVPGSEQNSANGALLMHITKRIAFVVAIPLLRRSSLCRDLRWQPLAAIAAHANTALDSAHTSILLIS